MRQGQLFPLLVDQNDIEEYIATQERLNYWKEGAIRTQKQINDCRSLLRQAQNLKEKIREQIFVKNKFGTDFSEIKIQGFVNQAKKGIQENKNLLSDYEYNINACEELLNEYSEYFAK
tara:strand:+ start:174 stop:527 length:354 start_codon:yes stop_codon:yes gene_type:complete